MKTETSKKPLGYRINRYLFHSIKLTKGQMGLVVLRTNSRTLFNNRIKVILLNIKLFLLMLLFSITSFIFKK